MGPADQKRILKISSKTGKKLRTRWGRKRKRLVIGISGNLFGGIGRSNDKDRNPGDREKKFGSENRQEDDFSLRQTDEWATSGRDTCRKLWDNL